MMSLLFVITCDWSLNSFFCCCWEIANSILKKSHYKYPWTNICPPDSQKWPARRNPCSNQNFQSYKYFINITVSRKNEYPHFKHRKKTLWSFSNDKLLLVKSEAMMIRGDRREQNDLINKDRNRKWHKDHQEGGSSWKKITHYYASLLKQNLAAIICTGWNFSDLYYHFSLFK